MPDLSAPETRSRIWRFSMRSSCTPKPSQTITCASVFVAAMVHVWTRSPFGRRKARLERACWMGEGAEFIWRARSGRMYRTARAGCNSLSKTPPPAHEAFRCTLPIPEAAFIGASSEAPIVYRLGHDPFKVERGVRLPLGAPASALRSRSAHRVAGHKASVQREHLVTRRSHILRQTNVLFRTQIQSTGGLKLRVCVGHSAEIEKCLAPFEMQPAPVGCVLAGFLEFREREVGAIFQHQRFAPHLQRIGETRAPCMRCRKPCHGPVEIAPVHQDATPIP